MKHLLLLILACSHLFAVCDRLEGGVDALYWVPLHGTVVFVRKVENPASAFPRATDIPFSTHYSWGVRPFIKANNGYWEARGQYIWYEAHDVAVRRSPVSNLLRPGTNTLGSLVRGSQLYEYQNADVRLGRWLGQLCGINVQLFLNGGWVNIERRQFWKVGAPETSASSLFSKDTFRGGVIGAGLEMRRSLWRCLELDLMVNPLVGIGRLGDMRRDRIAGTGVVVISQLDKITTCIPGIGARFGGRINFCTKDARWAIRFGYEINYYWQALTQQQLENGVVNQIFDVDSIGFAGPYIGLEIGF